MQPSKRRELAGVSWCLDGGAIILLDLEGGQYHAMDTDTSQRFLAFADGAEDDDLQDALTQAGLLGGQPSAPIVSKPLTFPVGLAMAAKTILAARRKLSKKRFRATLDWALSHQRRGGIDDPISSFRRAESVLPSLKGDLDCLPRALGLFAFLRHAARAPELVIGVKRYPFTAHAWVEIDGTPMLENDQESLRIASFQQILRVS
ncbi:MAG: lasso peptide biosynthesis B2 protein [Sulfitobacter sp.]